MSAIPVRNLFVMLAYASYDAGLLDERTIGACDFERPLDLVGRLLDSILRRLRRRGIDRRYVELKEQGTAPRGSIDVTRTITQLLQVRGELAWSVDELLPDTPANRVLKAALRALLTAPQVSKPVRQKLRAHLVWLHEVAEVPAREALRLRAAVPRTLLEYRTALRLARLALEQLLPDLGAAGRRAQALLSDPERMGDLFEKFVRGFARYELRGQAKVNSRHLEWDAQAENEQSLSLLPIMRTDVFLEWRDGRVTVCECKFYAKSLSHSHHGSVQKLRSGHLYQLLAYLRAVHRERSRQPGGLLLYAFSGTHVRASLMLEGFSVLVATLDLSEEWSRIRLHLRPLLEGSTERSARTISSR